MHPLVTQKDIADSIHYRVVVTVTRVAGLFERKTQDMVSITTSAQSAHDALVKAKDFLELEAKHQDA